MRACFEKFPMIVDDWIARKIGVPEGRNLTRAALDVWQLCKLHETLDYVYAHSSFYREGLAAAVESGKSFSRFDSPGCIGDLPFTTPADLVSAGTAMVCVPASEVGRIVTLPTSGTKGAPKRVWFTDADQELMVDYIRHGLPVMTRTDDVFLILMPCMRPGSIGDLVAVGVERIGARVLRVGAISTDGVRDTEVLELMRREGVSTGLATAHTAARLAKKSEGDAVIKKNMRTILLSAQYVSDEEKTAVEQIWDCKVYEHYGMTEMGLGGAMACETRVGYHPREADLLFEIVDPETGKVLPDGEYGEIVFTTLTRRAMPLIRYRTGDFSRTLPGMCNCGSVLKRLDRVSNRVERKAY